MKPCPRSSGLSRQPAKRPSCQVGKETSEKSGKRRTGQQINHNESTLNLLSGCPKNGVHLYGVREAAEAHGLDLVLDQAYEVGEVDYGALAAAAREADADLLAIGGEGQDKVELLKAVAQAGYVPRMFSIGSPASPAFVAGMGALARCVAGGAPWIPGVRASGFIGNSETLVARYEASENANPDHRAASGFGAVENLAEAIEAALVATGKIDPTAIRDHLFALETETVLGPFSVYPLGDRQSGAQRALTGLQIQWQDDGEGGLAPRVIHPEAVAEAGPCFLR